MTRLRTPAVWLGLLIPATISLGQASRVPNESVTIRIESATTQKRLAEAQDKIRSGNAAEAMTELQRILDENGDDLIASGNSLIPARRIAHALIGNLPPATLAAYRERVEIAAKTLLERGRDRRQAAPLRELLDRYFHARLTPDALLLLGDLELEAGEAYAAESTWRRLTPDASQPGWTVSTEPKDAAGIRARVTLAIIQQGDDGRSRDAIEQFKRTDAEAKGLLAGTNGRYLDTLVTAKERFVSLPSATSPVGSWTAVGGSAERSGRADSRLPLVWPSGPTWRSPLPPTSGKPVLRNPAEASFKSTANHAVIHNGYVYVAEADRIFSYELATGRSAVAYILPAEKRLDHLLSEEVRQQAKPDGDYSLAVANGRVYACLGSPGRLNDEQGHSPWPARYLAELTPTDNGKLTATWMQLAYGPVGARWEGPPAVADGRFIAAVVRVENGRLVQSLCAFDRSSNEPLWLTDVADSAHQSGDVRTRHELVTIHDGLAIFSTHTGAVVALHAKSGKPAWAVRYPQSRPTGKALVLASTANHRDLAVPVAHRGIVFVAPIDSERIYAVEARSGRILWERSGLRVESMLGVAGSRLIASLAGPVRGIRGFDTLTGSDEPPVGWRNHDDPGLASLGRGLVSDDQILWPTKAGLFVLRPQDGRLARPPILGPHGNLAYAEGVLIVVNPTEVLGFVIPESARRRRPSVTESTPPARISISAPTTVAVSLQAPKREQPLLPPTAPRQLAEPIDVPWAFGVVPGNGSGDPMLIGQKGVVPVSVKGELGEAIRNIPLGSQTCSIDSTHVFFEGTTLLRADPPTRFDTRTLHPEAEAIERVAGGNGTLAMQIGQHHIAALDEETLQLRWVIDSSLKPGYWPYRQPSAPQFGPHWSMTSAGIIAQRLDGRAVCLDMANGSVRFSLPSTISAWPLPPALTRVGVAFPAGPGRIVCLDPLEGDIRWNVQAENESGLTGESPSVRIIDDKLFVVIHRNHGVELQQLTTEKGQARWRRPVFLGAADVDLANADADDSTIFLAGRNRILAVRMIDGRAIWTRTLPDSPTGWRVISAIAGAIAIPNQALPREPSDADYAFRSFVRYPDPRRAFGILTTMGEPLFERTVPVIVFDSNNGRELRRFDLAATGPGVDSRFTATGGVVATAGRIYLFK